jgi:hypothetical protein
MTVNILGAKERKEITCYTSGLVAVTGLVAGVRAPGYWTPFFHVISADDRRPVQVQLSFNRLLVETHADAKVATFELVPIKSEQNILPKKGINGLYNFGKFDDHNVDIDGAIRREICCGYMAYSLNTLTWDTETKPHEAVHISPSMFPRTFLGWVASKPSFYKDVRAQNGHANFGLGGRFSLSPMVDHWPVWEAGSQLEYDFGMNVNFRMSPAERVVKAVREV